jgi:hypothetical protein
MFCLYGANCIEPFFYFAFAERVESMENETPQIVVPVEIREMTRIETEKGNIHVIQEITLGDLLVSTILIAVLVFMLVERFTRR